MKKVDDLLADASRYIDLMGAMDFNDFEDFDAIHALAHAAEACAETAQAMIMAQAMQTDASGRFRVLSVDIGS